MPEESALKKPVSDVAVIAVAVTTLAALALFFIWMLPILLTEHPRSTSGDTRLTAINNARTGVVAFAAAGGAAVGLIYTARTYRLTRRGQTAERFTKAVAQLGDSASSVRIGGLAAFGHLARYEPTDYDKIVFEVALAYLRDKSPWPAPSESSSTPGADVQAAVNLLRERLEYSRKTVDLRRVNLAGIDLQTMLLRDAKFAGSNLSRAKLNDCDVRGVDLETTGLDGAQFVHAKVAGVQALRSNRDVFSDAYGTDEIRWK